MSVHLAPIVAQKLNQFRRRRMLLIFSRGLSSGLITFLVAFTLVSAIDWYWLLSDQTRWYLSGAAYALVAIVVWSTGFRRMLHLPAMAEIALQMEMTEPELRENLLSAVELATDDPSSLNDSPVFRSLLQGKVAEQMIHVRVRKLLPVKLVAKWLVAAGVLIAVAVLLLSSEDPRFRHLATRAILPGANLARVSRIHVKVLSPSPQSQIIAEDETVAVAVAISGGTVSEVILETFSEEQGTTQRTMLGQSATEYIANLHVSDESVEYRILAGDAVTKRFRLESRPRPHVLAFQKTFHYPEYTQLPEKTVTDNSGDLIALSGTTVEVVVELDQDVSHAELQLSLDKTEVRQTISLKKQETKAESAMPEAERRFLWRASVPIEQASIYKVHLVSEETGFENIFSPRYEIRPEADLIPRAGFVDQQESTLLLPPSDILSLKGIAEDDLPLVKLEQQFSINGRDWKTLSLETDPGQDSEGRQLLAAWHWDLLNLELKAGDQVLTKLVATDRKGNIGESVPLRIVVAAQDFDPDRHQLMEKKIALSDDFQEFSELVETQKTAALEVVERIRKTNRDDAALEIEHKVLLDLAMKQQEQAAYLLAKIKDVGQQMPAGTDANDLDLAGKAMARLQREHAKSPAYWLNRVRLEADEKSVSRAFDELKRAYEKTADDAKRIAEHYQQFAVHNFLVSVAFDLDAIQTQQRLITESPTQTWDRLLRQETIVLNQLEILEELIRRQKQRLPNSIERPLVDLFRWSEAYRQKFKDAMESEDQLDQLQKLSQTFSQEIQHKQNYGNVDGGLPGRLVGGRRDLDSRAGNLYVPIEQLSRSVEQKTRLAAEAFGSSDSSKSKELLQEAEKYISEIDLKLLPSLEQLRDRREITQVRVDADAQYAADTGLTSRAIQFLMKQYSEVPPETFQLHDALREIAFAFRTLEAGHHFNTTKLALDQLWNQERWDAQSVQALLDHPRQWDFVSSSFELASQRLREAGVVREIIDPFDGIRWSAEMRDADRKISERRWKRDIVAGAGYELMELRENLSSVDEQLQPVLIEARKIIAKYAPTIPQMAQQAAEELRVLEESTTQTADYLEQAEATPQANQEQLAQLERQQAEINQQIEDLMEALVEDANSQDLLKEQQRERARDADDSIAMIQGPAKQMNQELQAAANAESQEQQAQDLAEAAEQQEKTAQALEIVAEHFDRLENQMDVAESRAELRQSEQEIGIARQMEQRYEESQQLAQMADQDSEDLLEQLTAELQNNPAMQQALSEIAKNAIENAQSNLEFAAQDDLNIQRANEQSDAEFKAKKKELSEELRRMGAEASRLSRELLAQANSAANSGKSPESRDQILAAQQKLNELANKANQAREDQLLEDLVEVAQTAQTELAAVTENLQVAKQETEKSKDEKIHQDDKSRDAQKKDFERRQQQFQEQQKRVARDLVRNEENSKRQADQNVKNSENQVRNLERQKKQAQDTLNKKPEDAGAKRNLEQADARVRDEQNKLATAKVAQKKAEERVQQAKQNSDEINRKNLPALNASNPASQLADIYTGESQKIAEELKNKAKTIADALNFGEELQPSRNQLAASESQQQAITQDIQQVADDVARAARHERRLQNVPASEALAAVAESIEQVAQGDSKTTEQQLTEAVLEAEQAESAGQPNQPTKSPEGLEAQSAVAATEQAIRQQAQQLDTSLQSLLASEQSSNQAEATATDGASLAAQNQSELGLPGSAAQQTPIGPQSQQPAFTATEMARAEQLARTLDELDRQLANAQNSNTEETPASPASGQPLETLSQAAKAQQAQLATTRAQEQQASALAINESDAESDSPPPATGPVNDFNVAMVNRAEKANWGKLRNKSAENLSKGRTEGISEEYRKSVEAYFKVLSERARKK